MPKFSNPTTIRPAEARDLPAILALQQATEGAPHWNGETYAAMLHEQNEPLRRHLLVAEDQGNILGFAVGKVLILAEETEAELESVVVASAARRQGLGKALCEALIVWARDTGAYAMHLEVRASNAGAIGLYAALQFGPEGVRKVYYERPTEDAVLMTRNLR